MDFRVTIFRQVYSGISDEESEQYGALKKDITLPFVPFVGLRIFVGVPETSVFNEDKRAVEIVSVCWSPEEQKFHCEDREWFGNELFSYEGKKVGIRDYLEEEVTVFWDGMSVW